MTTVDRDLELEVRKAHPLAVITVTPLIRTEFTDAGVFLGNFKVWQGAAACGCGWTQAASEPVAERAAHEVRAALTGWWEQHLANELGLAAELATAAPSTGSQIARLHLALEVISAHVNTAVLRMDADAPDETTGPVSDLARRVGLEVHHAEAGHDGPRSINPDGTPACERCTGDLRDAFADTMGPHQPAPTKRTDVNENNDRLYLALKGARERLCQAQTDMNPTDSDILRGALDRIDLVGADLPQWSRFDGGRA